MLSMIGVFQPFTWISLSPSLSPFLSRSRSRFRFLYPDLLSPIQPIAWVRFGIWQLCLLCFSFSLWICGLREAIYFLNKQSIVISPSQSGFASIASIHIYWNIQRSNTEHTTHTHENNNNKTLWINQMTIWYLRADCCAIAYVEAFCLYVYARCMVLVHVLQNRIFKIIMGQNGKKKKKSK